jgi:2-iminobutanoate/2-iminopropanoate deaminase
MKVEINTPNAPAPVGPYSQAILLGNLLFVSGQVALDATNPEAALPATVEEQSEKVLQNLSAVLQAAGMNMEHVLKTTIFLAEMADFAAMNAVYTRHFAHPFPARETVAAKALPKGALVEISCIASKG